jgi:hypothetical protein
MSTFTPVKALRNRQQPLTARPNQFITVLPYHGDVSTTTPDRANGSRRSKSERRLHSHE